MAVVIRVDSDQLRNWAVEIRELGSQYQSNYQKIQGEIDDLANTWQGEDNLAFKNKAHEFDDDFLHMFEEINDYVAYLEATAKKYDDVRENAIERAQALKGNHR